MKKKYYSLGCYYIKFNKFPNAKLKYLHKFKRKNAKKNYNLYPCTLGQVDLYETNIFYVMNFGQQFKLRFYLRRYLLKLYYL